MLPKPRDQPGALVADLDFDVGAPGHFLEAQRGGDLVDVWFLADDELPVDLADRPDEALLVQRRIIGTVQLLELVLEVGKTWLEAQPESVQDGEVGLVDAVHVAGDRHRRTIEDREVLRPVENDPFAGISLTHGRVFPPRPSRSARHLKMTVSKAPIP